MKKYYLLFLTMLLSLFSFSQTTYQLGSGTATTSYLPLYYLYDYNYTQTIYTAAELNQQGASIGGQITKIRYKATSAVSTVFWKDWVIYMGNSTKASFTSNSDWVPVTSLTQVFSGQIIANTVANDWLEITLTTPFTWDGTSNIVIAIDENTPDYGGSPSWAGYTLAPSTGNKAIYKYIDGTDINPSSPPTGSRTNAVAQIQFVGTLSPPCTGTPSGGAVSSATQIGCTPTAISVPTSGFSGLVYQWEESDDNGVADPWTDVSGATLLSYTPPPISGSTNKYYRLKTTCTSSSQSAYSTVHTVTIPAAPNAATNPTVTNITNVGATLNWTNGNGDRRVVVYNTTNNFAAIPSSGPAFTVGMVIGGSDTVGYDGTSASATITGLVCNTMYYFRIYEYKRCGASPNFTFFYAPHLSITATTTNYTPTMASMPVSNNFTGFTGTNLSAVFPGWEEKKGDGPLTGTTSDWGQSSVFTPNTTAKINLYTDSRKDWIISPTMTINAISRVKFQAAITGYNNGSVDPERMIGTDDKVEVMISSDACGGNTWVPLYTFDETTTVNLTNVLTQYEIVIPSQYITQNIRIGFKASDGPNNDDPDYDFHIANVVIESVPEPTLTINKTDISCFGGVGSATVTVNNGIAPLTYAWSPSGGTAATATGLVAGIYTVTVTDAANRVVTETIIIEEPDELISNISSTMVTCNGLGNGSITVAPTGGVAPYTYLWSNSDTTNAISNLAPGNYSVVITDDNGCTVTENVVIAEPLTFIIASTSYTDVTTYGGSDGSASVVVSGGTAPYSYLWSNNATTDTASNLVAGTYTVTVIDANGCTVTETFTIIQPIPLMVQSVSQKNAACHGSVDGTATIVVIGGNAPYSYLWSPTGGTNATATGLAAGTYSVLVTDATANTITESFTILEPDPITATISHQSDALCNGSSNGSATISVVGGSAPYTYTWSNGQTTTNATVSNLKAGNYTVNITDANGCKLAVALAVTIAQPSAIVFTTANATNISCYGSNDGSISVNVTGGVAPYNYVWSNGQSGSSIQNLAKGTYIVTVTDANNCTSTQTFSITEPAFVGAPTANNQIFCVGQNATLADVLVNGTNIKWYNTAVGGLELPATTVLTNGTTYYASQTVGTCESATRTAVQITLNQSVPITTSQLSVCGNTRIQNMIVDGLNYTQLRWYSSSTSAIPLASSVLLANGTYYVSSIIGTCESARIAIQVQVAGTVNAPIASFQTVCSGTTLNDLLVLKDPLATLEWFSSMQSMIPLPGTTAVATGTYYVKQVLGACESSKIAVQVQVTTVTTPTITSVTACEGTTIADYNNMGNVNYIWYLDNTTTTALADSYVLTSGTYYIANQNGTCISARKAIALNVGPRPASPTGQTTQLFTYAARVSNLAMNEPNVKWYLSAADAVNMTNELPANTYLTDATTYYGILTNANNCGSLIPTAVTVSLNLGNESLDLAELKYYPNPVDTELNISYNEEINKVEVFTITGQKVLSNTYQSKDVRLDLSKLSSGTYLVKIETLKASQFVKVIKR